MVVKEFGSREKMHISELPKPKLGTDSVLIRVKAASANPIDYKTREGKQRDAFPHIFPLVLGYDAAGIVEAVGPAAQGWAIGDEVIAYCRKQFVGEGTYAEYVVVPDYYLAAKPQSLDWPAAAALPLVALTAHQTLLELGLAANETILIHGGSGGVGAMAVQLAAARPANVIATAAGDQLDYVRELGARQVIDYQREDFVAATRSTHPDGVDCVLDLIGGETLRRSADAMRPGGRILSTVEPPENDFWRERGFDPHYILTRPDGEQLAELSRLVDEGRLRVNVSDVLPLERAAEALGRVEDGQSNGKIAIRIAD
jgi:NADPH:quinone reductase-like Zn-dependent oxidoreductase